MDALTFEMPEKQFKSIIGPNGAGKTTFFNLLSGELKPTEGEIYFKGGITKHFCYRANEIRNWTILSNYKCISKFNGVRKCSISCSITRKKYAIKCLNTIIQYKEFEEKDEIG